MTWDGRLMRAAFVLMCLCLVGCGDNFVPPVERPSELACDEPSTGTNTLLLVFDGLMLTDALAVQDRVTALADRYGVRAGAK